MASGTFGSLATQVQRLYGEGTVAGMSESQLLDRFLTARDEVAFEALLARHGPMVLAVCRRVLRDGHAAEDAFQATFLLLVRKAGSIRGTDLLGPWLHRVAYRVAVRAAKADAKRHVKETTLSEVVARAPGSENHDRGLGLALHEVVESLPEKYRAPVVLCYLEGNTHDEAAHCLKWPVGSVKGRLARARGILRTRLERRGLTVLATAVATSLMQESRASVPVPLREHTIASAMSSIAGKTAAVGMFSAGASVLVEETARAMMIKKIGILAAGIAAVAMLASGAAVVARQDSGKAVAARTATAVPVTSVKAEQTESITTAVQAEAIDENVTGAERAAVLNREIEKLRSRRDDAEAESSRLSDEIEILRTHIQDLSRIVTASEAFQGMVVKNEQVIDTTTVDGAKRLDRVQERLQISKSQLRKLQIELARSRRKLEVADGEIDRLRVKAALAASRPGKPNTVQRGDIIVLEVLEALPGRPISGERVVRTDGTISLGWYGDLSVDGLTRRQIKKNVIAHMRKFLKDETLGLVAMDEDGKEIKVDPADSDRVFVDDVVTVTPPAGATIQELERKLDRVIRELEELKSRQRPIVGSGAPK